MEHNTTALATLPPEQRAAIVLESGKAETQLRELVAKSAGITNVIDPAGREEAHRAGMTLKNARTSITKTGKAARDDAQAFSKAVIAEEKRLIGIIEPEEERIFSLRDAFDDKMRREKEEAERRERERVAAIRTKIDAIRQIPATMAGEPAAEIEKELFALDGWEPGQEFAEFKVEAFEAAQSACSSLSALLQRVKAQEQEAARIAAERAELERLRAEAAERERQARELREAEEARARAIREEEERRLAAERERFEDERRAFMLSQAQILRAAGEKVEDWSGPAMGIIGCDLAAGPDQSIDHELIAENETPSFGLIHAGTAFDATEHGRSVPLAFAYDEGADVLTVEGIRYAGELFRQLGGLIPVGSTFYLVERRDGVVTIGQVARETA